MENISDRIRTTIEKLVDSKGRPQSLEQMTGIPAETWRKFLSGKQRATLGMLESVSKIWPQYSFWFNTGMTDEKFGHQSSSDSAISRISESKTTISTLYLKARLEPMLHTVELATLNNGLEILEKEGLIASRDGQGSSWKSDGFNKLDMLEKFRLIDIFLENFILDLDIDSAVETFNFMRSKLKLTVENAPPEEGKEAEKLLLIKFNNVKNQIEGKIQAKRAWMEEAGNNK